MLRKQLLCLPPVLVVCALHSARASTNVDGAVAATLSEHGGVGLAAWAVEGRTGAMCMDGVAGVSVSGESARLRLEGDARYHIGSDTKSMTATLVAILIENGDISGWDATLGSLLPNIAPGTRYEEVTLKQLVSCLSGLPANPPNWWVYNQEGDIKAQRAACTADALATAPEADPGTAFIYSNWGFVVVGHVLEVLTESSWEALLRERLFAPLGITLDADTATFTGAPDAPLGHDDAHTPCYPATTAGSCDNAAVLGPAGTFSGPVAATSAYFAWHLRCHNGELFESETTSLLSQASCVAMHQPAEPSISTYGFGWHCMSRSWAEGDNDLACSHTGSNTLNKFVVWLGFGIDRAFMSFANSPDEPNGAMTDAAVSYLIESQGSEDCAERMESSVYTDTYITGDMPKNETRPSQISAAMRQVVSMSANAFIGSAALLL